LRGRPLAGHTAVMRRWCVIACAVGGLSVAAPVLPAHAAPSPSSPTSSSVDQQLAAASRNFAEGDYATVELLVRGLLERPDLPRPERAESLRLYGLALFFLSRQGEAEGALLAYLKLEPDAHLDPALLPPEAIAFFEAVRARHAGEIRRQRGKKRRLAVALIPIVGQFHNDQPTKGWLVAISSAALLAANLTTFAVLKSNCHPDRTCSFGADRGRTLRTVNILSGMALVGVLVYGVVDGGLGYYKLRRLEQLQEVPVAVGPRVDGGWGATLTLHF